MTPAGAPNRLTPPKTELRYVHRPSQGRRPAVNVSPLKLWQRFPAVWSLLVHRPPPSSSLSNDAPCALHCGITALVTRRVHTAGCVTTTSLWLPLWRLVQPATYSVIIIIIIIIGVVVVVVGNGLEVDTSTIDLKMNVILGLVFFFNLNQHLFKRTHVYL